VLQKATHWLVDDWKYEGNVQEEQAEAVPPVQVVHAELQAVQTWVVVFA